MSFYLGDEGIVLTVYQDLLSPNQWPSESALPKFRSTLAEYIKQMSAVSMRFTSLIAESLDLPATAFDRFFDQNQQHKLKVVKYPDNGKGAGQGTSYLLQASPHKGLQAQNTRGEWIDCPPIRGSLVVAIGQGLEAITGLTQPFALGKGQDILTPFLLGGVCASTTHRVLSPEAGKGARFSIPFFQGVG
nr:putative iron/ascorbate oxidoreductase [Quercus suber]POE66135.1 putative iron/ascorbate oxidoreductase [Quercus suber]